MKPQETPRPQLSISEPAEDIIKIAEEIFGQDIQNNQVSGNGLSKPSVYPEQHYTEAPTPALQLSSIPEKRSGLF